MIEKILEIYGLGKLQDLLTIADHLELEGFSLTELKELVKQRKAELVQQEKLSHLLERDCPSCGEPLTFQPVNMSLRDKTGDNSTFVWTCFNCGEQIWTKKKLSELVRGG